MVVSPSVFFGDGDMLNGHRRRDHRSSGGRGQGLLCARRILRKRTRDVCMFGVRFGQRRMPVAPFNPGSPAAGAWSGTGGAVWTRNWHGGRIAWVGVGDWHRYAIGQPQQLGMWWQDVLDLSGVRREDEVVWEAPREMPLTGQRLGLCAQGVRGEHEVPSGQGRRRMRRGVAAPGRLAGDAGAGYRCRHGRSPCCSRWRCSRCGGASVAGDSLKTRSRRARTWNDR